MLDLYQGRWQGKLLEPGEFVICADEKPSIQARARIHPTRPPASCSGAVNGSSTSYQLGGALTYLAALNIGRRGGDAHACSAAPSPSGGIEPFDRLVRQVMTKQPYASARRVFWIVDNGSSTAARNRSSGCSGAGRTSSSFTCPSTPAGSTRSRSTTRSSSASCSSPTTSTNLAALARTLNAFEHRWNEIAEPFEWSFTRDDLAALIDSLTTHDPQLQLAA